VTMGIVLGVSTFLGLLLIWYGLPAVAVLTHRSDNIGERS